MNEHMKAIVDAGVGIALLYQELSVDGENEENWQILEGLRQASSELMLQFNKEMEDSIQTGGM